jgi:alkanesulfonate monooxygenase SsuD/methylene tetrahydromethanopterin reductase-like flavin-dependent oxidoreductase (luciferase family)
MSGPAPGREPRPVDIGIGFGHRGLQADPATFRLAARAAEQIGYSSIWVVGPDVLDLAASLTQAATVTDRIRLGAGLLLGPGADLAALARPLSVMGRAAGARFVFGVSEAEPPGRDLSSVMDVVDRTWAPGTPGRPPVLFGGAAGSGIDTASARADGWVARDVRPRSIGARWAVVRSLARQHGRDPDALALVVPARVALTDAPLADPRPDYEGDLAQVAGDVTDAARGGATEVVLLAETATTIDELLDTCARITEAVQARTLD